MVFGPIINNGSNEIESHQLINQDSGDFEYYTPAIFTAAARAMFNGIDLDPASSVKANRLVDAKNIFTIEDDGLQQKWFGKVWMNHPFSKGEKACPTDWSKCNKDKCKKRGYHIDYDIPGNLDWTKKITSEYKNENVEQALMICFASTSEAWFKPLLDYPICFIDGRVNYLDKDYNPKKGAPKGSVITYLGDDIDRFKFYFSKFGKIKA